jgi:ABC-2 type transport system permease protein
MVSFWTTRVSALFELYFVLELLLSGRLVPLTLMPHWAQVLANLLPFKWTFGYPIEALVGDLSVGELLGGLGMQALWTSIGGVLVWAMWRRAIRRYTAVNN